MKKYDRQCYLEIRGDKPLKKRSRVIFFLFVTFKFLQDFEQHTQVVQAPCSSLRKCACAGSISFILAYSQIL